MLRIRAVAPHVHISSSSLHQTSYALKTKDDKVVQQVLQLLDSEKKSYGVQSYDILGTTIEDIFLDLMAKNDIGQVGPKLEDAENASEKTPSVTPPLGLEESRNSMDLATGRRMSPFRQAFTIFHKRVLIARRSWLTPVLTVLIAIAGSCIPMVFLSHRPVACGRRLGNSTTIPLYLPNSPVVPFTFGFSSRAVDSPPGVIKGLGSTANNFRVTDETDTAAFSSYINQNYRNLSLGGVAFDFNQGDTLVAWEATPPGIMGPSMLNMASNVLYNRALNQTRGGNAPATIIKASFTAFPPIASGTLASLRWMAFFAAVMVSSSVFIASGDALTNMLLPLDSPSIPHSLRSMYQESGGHRCRPCSYQMGSLIRLGYGLDISCLTRFSR